MAESQHGSLVNSLPTTLTIQEEYLRATKEGNLPLIRRLVDDQPRNASSLLRTRDENGFTGLHWASLEDRLQIVQFLIDNGLDTNDSENETGISPLHWASIRGNLLVVDLLLTNDAKISKVDKMGYSALQHAVQNGHTLLVHYLHEKGADLKSIDNEGHTALHWAAFKGDVNTLLYLLYQKCPVNAVDVTRWTPLHWAVFKGNVECVKVLVEHHADINHRDNCAFTAVHYAKSPEILQYLNFVEKRGLERAAPSITGNPFKKVTVAAIPFIAYPIAFYLFTSVPLYVGVIGGFFGMVFAASIMPYMWPNRSSNTPFPAAYAAATLFWEFIHYLFVFLPETADYRNLLVVFVMFYAACCYTFFKSIFAEPGTIEPSKSTILTSTDIARLVRDQGMKAKDFCAICHIRQPLRSKHCRLCNKCVARFDHHCPWIYNCVGVNNHLVFLLFLILVSISGTFIVAYGILYFSVKPSVPPMFPLYDFVLHAYMEESGPMICAVWCAGHVMWFNILLFTQVRAILTNWTIFERLVARRKNNFYNPFDHGLSNNVKEFLQLPRHRVDWFRTFSMNEYLQV